MSFIELSCQHMTSHHTHPITHRGGNTTNRDRDRDRDSDSDRNSGVPTLPHAMDAEQAHLRQLLPADLLVRHRGSEALPLQLAHDLLGLAGVLVRVQDVGGTVNKVLTLADA